MHSIGIRLLLAVLILAAALTPGVGSGGSSARADDAPVTFPEYANTSGRALPILEGGSGQPVRIGDDPWVLQPDERFFSLPWGDAPRFRWGDKSYHYIGTVGGTRFRFFLVEDWGPVEPIRWIEPLRKSGAPRFTLKNRSDKPVPVLDGVSGRSIFFGKEQWAISPGDSLYSHAWTDNQRFVLDGKPYHFIGTAGSTSFFNFFVAPDHNYHETGCANDWTITFYGVADELSFGDPKVPVVTADRPHVPLGHLSLAFLQDARLQGTGIGRGFADGQPRYLVVQNLAHNAAGQPVTATIKLVDQPAGRSGPVIPWKTVAGPSDLAYRWQYATDGPFTRVHIEKLGDSGLPKDLTDRLVGQTFHVTDTGGAAALAPTNHHLDVFVGPLDRKDPGIQAILKQGRVKDVTVCVSWP